MSILKPFFATEAMHIASWQTKNCSHEKHEICSNSIPTGAFVKARERKLGL